MRDVSGTPYVTLYSSLSSTYRGYQYDTVSGLYYLQSRYYNPEWGRFLNADICLDTESGVLGTNLFAYCDNNPVNYVDSTGMFKGEYHYGKTYNIAKPYNEGYAKILATYNKKVDSEYSPLNIFNSYYQSFHFNINDKNPNAPDSRTQRFEEMHNKAMSYAYAAKSSNEIRTRTARLQQAFQYFGRSIHPLQDSIAHSGPGGNQKFLWFYKHKGGIDDEERLYDNSGMTIGQAGELVTAMHVTLIFWDLDRQNILKQ